MPAKKITIDNIAILAGGGAMPHIIKAAHPNALMIGIAGHCADAANYIHVGQVGKLFHILKDNHINKLCMIGSLERPKLSALHLDLTGLYILLRYGLYGLLKSGGDNRLLVMLKKILQDRGINIIGAHRLCPDLLIPEGVLTQKQPNAKEQKLIASGIQAAQDHGRKDLGQAVIVSQQEDIAYEDSRGTDALIKNHGSQGCVLIKAIKPEQDEDLDMPAIGMNTLKNIQAQGGKGVAAIAGKTLLADPLEELIAYAEAHDLFLVGVQL